MSKFRKLAAFIISASMAVCSLGISASADSGNLVKNSKANDGLNYWTADNTGWFTDISLVKPVASKNTKGYDSYFFTSASCSAAQTRIYQDINVKKYAGKKSVLSAYVRAWDDGDTDESLLMVEFLDKSGHVLDTGSQSRSGSASWAKISVTKTIPKKAVTARVSLNAIKHTGSHANAYFDNVSFIVKGNTDSSSSDNVTISDLQVSMKVGETLSLIAKTSAETDDNILWKSSNTNVAKVSSEGKITAKAKGTTVISATLGNSTKNITVTVTK